MRVGKKKFISIKKRSGNKKGTSWSYLSGKRFPIFHFWEFISLAFVLIKGEKIPEELSQGTQISSQTVPAAFPHLQVQLHFP